MNILTAYSWFVLYPNATFDRKGMWGTGLPDVGFAQEASSAGYELAWGSLCDTDHTLECPRRRRVLSTLEGVAVVRFPGPVHPPAGTIPKDPHMQPVWKLSATCVSARDRAEAMEDAMQVLWDDTQTM